MQGNLSRVLLAIFFIVAGCLHFIFPASYMKVMPHWLPEHYWLVLVSGGFEIAGGLGVLLLIVRRWAGYGLILLSLAVLPANVQMLLNALTDGTASIWLVLLGLRLPLQLLLIYWIWRATQPVRDRMFRG
jgi:uncharacterized membrane protein